MSGKVRGNAMKSLILASQSPRRRELLEKCGLPFTVDAADIDETIDPAKDLVQEIERLAVRKAQAVLERHPQDVVIGSDTIVTIDGKVLGKPHTPENAGVMLRQLSGRTHQVITGLCMLSSSRRFSTATVSNVTFAKMDDAEISEYIATGEPLDKAGAYAIQGIGSRYIAAISGDYYSIMGLPVSILYNELKNISLY
jgi:septum formation protein